MATINAPRAAAELRRYALDKQARAMFLATQGVWVKHADARAQIDALREQIAMLTDQRDGAIEDAKEIRARWNDAENEFAAMKAQPKPGEWAGQGADL